MTPAASRTLRLSIAYDGTRFSGWQMQNGARTVQSALEQAFRQILQERVRVIGAGRTDSGVHAEQQVAHAAIRSPISLSRLRRALNAVLPEDLVVRSVQRAPPGFHARYSAVAKWYRYSIWNDPTRPVFDRERLLHIPAPLDLNAMRQAALRLRGRHDFRSFHSAGRPVASTVRTLRRLSILRRGKRIEIHAEADGFLYHMVRRIAGFLLEVGRGSARPADAFCTTAPTAPARGLCLMRVRYARDESKRGQTPKGSDPFGDRS